MDGAVFTKDDRVSDCGSFNEKDQSDVSRDVFIQDILMKYITRAVLTNDK